MDSLLRRSCSSWCCSSPRSLLIPIGFRLYRNTLVDDTSRTLVETLRRARTYAQTGRGGAAYGVKIVSASNSARTFPRSSLCHARRFRRRGDRVSFGRNHIRIITTETIFSTLRNIYGGWRVDRFLWRAGVGREHKPPRNDRIGINTMSSPCRRGSRIQSELFLLIWIPACAGMT